MPDIIANGIRIRYDDRGSGDPVFFVHGFTASRAMWFGQVPAIAKHYRVIVPDLRGHGESFHPGSGYNMKTLAADLAGLMESLAIPRAHVVGLSMGGMAAQRMALDYPGLVASLTLADTFPGRPATEIIHTFQRHLIIIRERGMDALFEHLLIHPALPAGPGFEVSLEQIEDMRSTFMMNELEAMSGFVSTFVNMPDWSDELRNIGCPVLLAVGELDEPCVEPMQGISKAIPHSEFHVIRDAGHAAPVENAPDFNRLLLDFLARSAI